MIRERNFHDEWKQLIQEADRMVTMEEAQMTPERRSAEQKSKWEGLQKIWDHLEQQEQGKNKVPEEVLRYRFERLYAVAYRLAEACSLNVRMERIGTVNARLTLRSDLFLLGDAGDQRRLWTLMQNAGSVLVRLENGLIQFDFTYDLRGVE